MKPLAIFGGTFDPVHIGHLCVAWEASELLDAEVRLMPASVPPHRTAPVATPAERVALLRAALAGQDRLQLDLRELERDGPSYTVDTLRSLRVEQGSRPLVLLMGVDAFAGLPDWHRWEDLFGLAHFAVLNRPGAWPHWPEALRDHVAGRRVESPAALHGSPSGHVLMLDVTALAISATRVRGLLAEARMPRYLLPDNVFRSPELLAPYLPASRM